MRYYMSWHTLGCLHTRCFDSDGERAAFRRLVDCKGADVYTWEA